MKDQIEGIQGQIREVECQIEKIKDQVAEILCKIERMQREVEGMQGQFCQIQNKYVTYHYLTS